MRPPQAADTANPTVSTLVEVRRPPGLRDTLVEVRRPLGLSLETPAADAANVVLGPA